MFFFSTRFQVHSWTWMILLFFLRIPELTVNSSAAWGLFGLLFAQVLDQDVLWASLALAGWYWWNNDNKMQQNDSTKLKNHRNMNSTNSLIHWIKTGHHWCTWKQRWNHRQLVDTSIKTKSTHPQILEGIKPLFQKQKVPHNYGGLLFCPSSNISKNTGVYGYVYIYMCVSTNILDPLKEMFLPPQRKRRHVFFPPLNAEERSACSKDFLMLDLKLSLEIPGILMRNAW